MVHTSCAVMLRYHAMTRKVLSCSRLCPQPRYLVRRLASSLFRRPIFEGISSQRDHCVVSANRVASKRSNDVSQRQDVFAHTDRDIAHPIDKHRPCTLDNSRTARLFPIVCTFSQPAATFLISTSMTSQAPTRRQLSPSFCALFTILA